MKLYWKDLEIQEANGEFPEYLKIKDRELYCDLCQKKATDQHLASRRHGSQVSNWEENQRRWPSPPPPSLPSQVSPLLESTEIPTQMVPPPPPPQVSPPLQWLETPAPQPPPPTLTQNPIRPTEQSVSPSLSVTPSFATGSRPCEWMSESAWDLSSSQAPSSPPPMSDSVWNLPPQSAPSTPPPPPSEHYEQPSSSVFGQTVEQPAGFGLMPSPSPPLQVSLSEEFYPEFDSMEKAIVHFQEIMSAYNATEKVCYYPVIINGILYWSNNRSGTMSPTVPAGMMFYC